MKWEELTERILDNFDRRGSERVKLKGSVTAILRDKDGNIKETRECKL